jgi:uncharacterized membrane protein YjfL (UPF0719 family)
MFTKTPYSNIWISAVVYITVDLLLDAFYFREWLRCVVNFTVKLPVVFFFLYLDVKTFGLIYSLKEENYNFVLILSAAILGLALGFALNVYQVVKSVIDK